MATFRFLWDVAERIGGLFTEFSTSLVSQVNELFSSLTLIHPLTTFNITCGNCESQFRKYFNCLLLLILVCRWLLICCGEHIERVLRQLKIIYYYLAKDICYNGGINDSLNSLVTNNTPVIA